jgi:hypothetical protein
VVEVGTTPQYETELFDTASASGVSTAKKQYLLCCIDHVSEISTPGPIRRDQHLPSHIPPKLQREEIEKPKLLLQRTNVRRRWQQ